MFARILLLFEIFVDSLPLYLGMIVDIEEIWNRWTVYHGSHFVVSITLLQT